MDKPNAALERAFHDFFVAPVDEDEMRGVQLVSATSPPDDIKSYKLDI